MSIKTFIEKMFGQAPKTQSNSIAEKSFDEKYNDLGEFIYESDGFFIKIEGVNKKIRWDEITELNVYKADLFPIDRIEMEIVCSDRTLTISEDVPGWYQFVLK